MRSKNSLVRRTSYNQVFAKGVGAVYRRRVYQLPYTYVDSSGRQISSRQFLFGRILADRNPD